MDPVFLEVEPKPQLLLLSETTGSVFTYSDSKDNVKDHSWLLYAGFACVFLSIYKFMSMRYN